MSSPSVRTIRSCAAQVAIRLVVVPRWWWVICFGLTACRLGFIERIGVDAAEHPDGDSGPTADADELPCDPTGVDTPLGAVGTMVTKATDPATAPSDGERVQLSSGDCPTFTGQSQRPYRAYVVQNNEPQPITVSAWASCITGDTAVLTFYRRATPPRTRTERMACEVAVTTMGSPDMTSLPCPGLLASASRGLPLATCEKAVVWIQGEAGTLPMTLHIRVD